MLSPHHRNDVKNPFRHQKRQRSYQFRHVNMLNIPNALHRRARPIAGAQRHTPNVFAVWATVRTFVAHHFGSA